MQELQQLEGYQLLSQLGEGGMGRVYKARELASGRLVALKLLAAQGSDGELATRRFKREFRAAARLRHPHIASVYEIHQDGEQLYFSMEYVEGEPLHRRLNIGEPLEPEQLNHPERIELLLGVLGQLALALDYTHGQQLIHRDIKPDNIMVRLTPAGEFPVPAEALGVEGAQLFYQPCHEQQLAVAKLLDFGLARQLDLSTRLTRSGVIMGTVDYMAPEQVMGGEIDARSDLYALGVVLYEALANRLPFQAPEAFTVLLKHAYEAPPPIRASNPDVDPRLEDIAFKLLCKDPQDRYQSARELLGDLVAVRTDGELDPRTSVRLPSVTVEASLAGQGRLFAPRVIGRSGQQEQLEELLLSTLGGHGQALVLLGEGGVGKTRLIEEARRVAQLKGLSVHQGAAYEEQPVPYGPFLGVFEQLARELDGWPRQTLERALPRDVRALAPLSPRLLELPAVAALPEPVELDPDQQKYRLFATAAELLRVMARQQPRVLVLEDLQWADAPSLELGHYLVRNVVFASQELGDPAAAAPLSMLLSLRDDELESSQARLLRGVRRTQGVRELKLERLEPTEVGLMVQSMLGREKPPEELVEWIYSETQGNPLFIEEVMGGLVTEGVLVCAGGRWRVQRGWSRERRASPGLPRGIRELMRRRLDKLDEHELRVARVAAVIGNEFGFELLLEVSELEEDELLDVVDGLIRAKVLVESSQEQDLLCFAYRKLREVLLDGVMERRKRRIHERVGQALERRASGRPEETVALAHHYLAASNHSKALHHLPAAGELHRQRFNTGEAVRCFARVLEILDGLPEPERAQHQELRLRTLLQLGQAESLLCDYEPALSHLDSLAQAAQAAEQGGPLAQALVAQADIFLRRGDYADALQLTQRALELFEQQQDALGKAACINSLGRIYWHQGRLDAAREAFEQALAIRSQANDDYGIAVSHNNIFYCYFVMADYRRALQHLEHALALWRATGNRRGIARCLESMANVAQRRGAYREGLVYVEEALRTCRELGDRAGVGYCLISLGNVHVYLGSYLEALEAYGEAHELYVELGEIRGIAICLGNLARALIVLGDHRQALEHLGRSLKLSRKIGECEQEAIAMLSLADLYRDLGEDREALRCYRPALSAFREQGESFGLCIGLVGRAESELRSGEAGCARSDVAEALTLARRSGARELEARALLASARLGGNADEARQALELADELGVPELRAQTRELLAGQLVAAGQTGQARELLEQAVSLLEDLAEGLEGYRKSFLRRTLVSGVVERLERLESRGEAPVGSTSG